MKRVGILGGMGPEATILLMQKIINGIKAEDDSNHIPMIVHQNTQVPSRIERIIEGNGADPAPVLKKMAKDLQDMNCDFLAMPCNTAHYYYSDICESVTVPLLNMIELSAQKLVEQKLSKIGVLASPAIKKIGIFDEMFKQFGFESKLSEDDIGMLKIIKTVKKGGLDKPTIANFKSQVSKLIDFECDGILIACTELSLLSDYIPKSLPYVDSLDCLAEKIISMAMRTETEFKEIPYD